MHMVARRLDLRLPDLALDLLLRLLEQRRQRRHRRPRYEHLIINDANTPVLGLNSRLRHRRRRQIAPARLARAVLDAIRMRRATVFLEEEFSVAFVVVL